MPHEPVLFQEYSRAPQYSAAVMPPENIIQDIRLMKKKLQDAIGWYHSCHSDAHITFNVFRGGEPVIGKWMDYVKHFAALLGPMRLCFNKTGVFSNGAFILLPDEVTDELLTGIMKSFRKGSPYHHFGKPTQPHISIGRRLTMENIEIAKQVIPACEIAFTCDNIALRKLNNEKRQYDVYKRFYFGGGNNAVEY